MIRNTKNIWKKGLLKKYDILKIFTARYDVEKDQILGCNPGTLLWHHEVGHKKQLKKPRIKRWYGLYKFFSNFNISLSVLIGFYFFQYKFDEILAVGLILFLFNFPLFLFLLYLEFNAWIYAIKRYKK